ncbi:RNA ligase RtcB family protein [Halocynthiibacter namhaensis]|uniref:RNA ligase RtcB family protein n=1 Tax=Halocynthiibacter namhaensis TaxID=1290553 RepID=UPI0005795BC9|nr:RNA ligase RtcB family protein [Halocynthiibacter namhaensis]
MGNFASGRVLSAESDSAAAHLYYTKNAWIDGRAEDQLREVARLDGVRKIAAFPDLHPGKYGPVGCAVLSDKLHPQLVGSDIGCGMSLFALDLPARKLKLEKAERRLRALALPYGGGASERLKQEDLPADLFAGALGSIGGGNHFCEVQRIVAGGSDGFLKDQICLLVHSGSRGLGHALLQGFLAQGRVCFNPDSTEGKSWLAAHNQAVRWARLNRQIFAERAAEALRCDLHLLSDCPHNLVTQEFGAWLHRKGAARLQPLVPLAGSRASAGYVLRPMDHPANALNSCAHGAGRKYDRASMHGRIAAKKSVLDDMRRPTAQSRVICDDKSMLIEEAPLAYKSATHVAQDLADFGIAETVAKVMPLITFKNAKEGAR